MVVNNKVLCINKYIGYEVHISSTICTKYNLKIDNILEEFKIERLRNKQIYKLSGGEKKVVAIAGIIVMNPEIILMDEVTASLDPKSRRTVINLIRDLKETIVIASHDLDMILDVCDRVLVFSNGEIIKEGSSYTILSNKKIMEESNLELPLSLIKK